MKRTIRISAVLASAWWLAATAPAAPADRPIALGEAIELALAAQEDILVRRERVAAADAAIEGAHGAYDLRLGAIASWAETTAPANSSFSGAPTGRLAPTVETTSGRVELDQYLPTGGRLSLWTAADKSETDGVFGLLSPAYGTEVAFELRQPILRGRAIDPERHLLTVTRLDRDAAGGELKRVVTETVAAVERAYWTLVAARREVAVREEAVRLADEQLGETRTRIESGIAPELEISQPQAEVERRRGETLAAREAATRAENTLKLLVLTDQDEQSWSDRLVPADGGEPAVEPVDVATAMKDALAQRPELTTSAAVLERRRAETALAKDAVKPALDAVAAYGRFGLAGDRNPAGPDAPIPSALRGGLGDSFDLLTDGDLDETRLSLVLALPLRNRAAKAQAAIAASVERQAGLDLQGLRKVIRAEVLDAAAEVDTAGQRIAAARAARAAAEVQLDSERDRYGAGMSTNFLVLTRQNDLSRARLDEIAAQTDYRRAAVALARVTGRLLAERDIHLEDIH